MTNNPSFNYMYFVKIVPTSYLPLGWEKRLKQVGFSDGSLDGSVETHQYSVTSHKRSLQGGNDAAEGHAERQHSQGGIPGVFFSYVSQSPRLHLPFVPDANVVVGHFPNESRQP
jgi:hypothetical protein